MCLKVLGVFQENTQYKWVKAEYLPLSHGEKYCLHSEEELWAEDGEVRGDEDGWADWRGEFFGHCG